MSRVIAPVLRDINDKHFDNFEKAYKEYYNSYTEDEQKKGYYYSAAEIYYEVAKYNNVSPMENLHDNLYEQLQQGNFFSAMIIGMVSRNNMISNSLLDEDLFDKLHLEDTVGAGKMIEIYNLLIESFINGSLDNVYERNLNTALYTLKSCDNIDENEYRKCQFLIENYPKYQELINVSIELNNNCADAVEEIHFFNENGDIYVWEHLTNGSLYYNKNKLIQDLDNYYENAINENLDNIWKNLRDGVDTIGNFIKKQYENWKDGVEIIQGGLIKDTAKRIQKSFSTARVTGFDPLIFDLDGDGYNVKTKDNGANFDLDKNGFAEKINWTSRDGFLCLDLNGNGTIDNGGELFGDQTLLADGTRAKNGFCKLFMYAFYVCGNSYFIA